MPSISEEDKTLMENLLRAGPIKHKYAVRIQAVLLRGEGTPSLDVAACLRLDKTTPSKPVKRYNEFGIEGLLRDKSRKNRQAVSPEKKNEGCRIARNEKPKDETHWSTRTLAKRVGITHTKVNRILSEAGIKPHIVKKRPYSNDVNYVEKLTDVVGWYLNPPDNALVLGIDEKTPIQALERAEPVLPMFRALARRQRSDYCGCRASDVMERPICLRPLTRFRGMS